MNQADSVTASISVTDFAGNTGTLTGSTKAFTDDNVPPAAITSFAGASGETLIINKADNDGVAVEVGLPDSLIVGDIISIRIGSNEIATHTIASGEESGGLAKKAFTITESTIVGTNSGQDGTYTLKAFIVDAKGNEREFTTSRDVLVDNVDPEITNADIISDDSSFTPGNGDTNGKAHRINKADEAGNIDGFMRVDLTGNNDVQVGYQYKLEMNTAVDNSAIPKVTVQQSHINNGFIDVPIDADYFATQSQTLTVNSNNPHSQHAFIRVTDLAGNTANTSSFNVSLDKIAPDAANLSNTSNNQDDIIYNIASSGQITLRADLGDPASIVTTQGVKAIGTISQSDVVKLYQKVAGTADSNFQEVASRTLTSSDMDAGKVIL